MFFLFARNEAKKERKKERRRIISMLTLHIGTPHRNCRDAPPRIKQANMR